MSDSKASVTTNGVSGLSLLGVVFVTLKLLGITDVATWSWWWVTAPFWGGAALFVAFFLIAILVAAVVASRR